jgi:aryl-alcohol dehydrogenase-like predicted oxidoreductase/enamine deaminase RidA (YjgF/YER057c/UK114 family)
MTAIERVRLGGLSITRVITGLWQIADLERSGTPVDSEAAAAEMARYAEQGFTSFDLADHYGSAEDIAGVFRAGFPAGRSAELLTKWVPAPGPVSRDQVRSAVQRALQRTRSERIDVLQFHAWSYPNPAWLDALFHLDELRAEGLIGGLGLTNFDTAHLRIVGASGIPVVANQVSFSLLDSRARGPMSRYCIEHGIALLAYGTVAGGWLSSRWLGAAEPDWERSGTWSEMKYGRFIRTVGGWDRLQRLLRVLDLIARRHGVSVTNVATRAILDQPAVAAVIIGARLGRSDHLADNRRLFDLRLTAADQAEIDEAIATLSPIPGDTGDEYRRPPFLTASGDLAHHLSEFPAPYRTEVGWDERIRCTSGTRWESLAGFARAVRVGNRIVVSGTTASHGARLIGGTDPAAQTHFVIDKIEGAIQSLGGRLDQVVRTRVFVKRIEDWEPVARAHGERFAAMPPANTLVQAELVGAEYLVEIEAEAELR